MWYSSNIDINNLILVSCSQPLPLYRQGRVWYAISIAFVQKTIRCLVVLKYNPLYLSRCLKWQSSKKFIDMTLNATKYDHLQRVGGPTAKVLYYRDKQ